MYWKAATLLIALCIWSASSAQSPLSEQNQLPTSGESLRYRVVYQGVLSAFNPVEIALARLYLHPGLETVDAERLQHASLEVTTENSAAMEAVYPLRFFYDSWFDRELRYTTRVELRKHTSKSYRDLLWFNRTQAEVRSYRRVEENPSRSVVLTDALSPTAPPEQHEGFRERHVQKLASPEVLDRLAMLYALRTLQLQPGMVVEPVVANGNDLHGYQVTVEERELLQLDNRPSATLRLRLVPLFATGEDPGYTVFLWLSDDTRRLPLRFRSSRFGGSIELNLSQDSEVATAE